MSHTVSMIAAGDLCTMAPLDALIGTDAEAMIFSDIRPLIDSTDISLVNLENPLIDGGTPIAKAGPNLKGAEAGVSLIRAAGFNCAILANNHIGDFGSEGVMRTLEVLKGAGVETVGAGANLSEAAIPWIAERNGMRVAVLATAENEFGGASDSTPGSNGYQASRIIGAIFAARQKTDYVVIVMHGGNELNPVPSPVVVDRYRSFIDAGADSVIGMHPHCPQGFEVYRGKPIFYSCGNYLFGYPGQGSPLSSWYYGYLPRIVFDGPQTSLSVHPYRFSPEGDKITLLTGAEKDRFLNYLDRISAVIADPQELQKHYEGWCVLEGGKLIHGLLHEGKPIDPGTGPITDKPTLIMRNILTCEAHNHLASTYMRMVCDGRLETCRQYIQDVKDRQQIP
ncbi:MAG: CapA family protein [Bacillota bacterium]|nr:CapA family protein [Bacillota bacterium]